MNEDEFEKAMESYQLENEYWAYVEEHMNGVRHEAAIFDAVESGDFYDDFKDTMVTK